MSDFSVSVANWDDLGPGASVVRFEVFVREQKVPPELEVDADDAACVHALARDLRGNPVGTGRLRPDGYIGRMAVLRPWRKKGVGSALLQALLREAARLGLPGVVLSAQCHACAFYAAHGFVCDGEIFMDAGIQHITMVRPL